MCNSNGYISKKQYITRFKTWNNALEISGLLKKIEYNKETIIKMLQDFNNKYNRLPRISDTNGNTELPSIHIIIKFFGTFNNAMIAAELDINKTQTVLNGNEICDYCGTSKTVHWNNVDTFRVCDKCSRTKRDFIHGVLDPNSTTGMGYISEYVIYHGIAGDSKWLNNDIDSFNGDYDMYHDIYGNVSIKSSTLHIYDDVNSKSWQFCISSSNKIPDTYIFVGFNTNKDIIEHIWVINSKDKIVNKKTFRITKSIDSINRYKKYEINCIKFNNIYLNLNIYKLFPFRNLPKYAEVGTV